MQGEYSPWQQKDKRKWLLPDNSEHLLHWKLFNISLNSLIFRWFRCCCWRCMLRKVSVLNQLLWRSIALHFMPLLAKTNDFLNVFRLSRAFCVALWSQFLFKICYKIAELFFQHRFYSKRHVASHLFLLIITIVEMSSITPICQWLESIGVDFMRGSFFLNSIFVLSDCGTNTLFV